MENSTTGFVTYTFYTSTAYRYTVPEWSEEKNSQTFGEDHSMDGVGYNLCVQFKVPISLDKAGLKERLKAVAQQVDHKYLNTDVKELSQGPVSLERIGIFLQDRACHVLDTSQVSLKIHEGPDLSFECGPQGQILNHRFKIQCVHQHWNPELSSEENKEMYGKCSGLHGHEYGIDVSLIGEVDPESKLLCSRKKFARVVRDGIVDPLHGSFLNDTLGNTSGEKIALYVFDKLHKAFTGPHLCRVGIRETLKNSFYVGSPPF